MRRTEIPRLEQLGVTRRQVSNLGFGALARVRGAGGEDLGTLRDVWAYYESLFTGRLVVVGEPGAGKTVLGLHLLLDLLDHRDDERGGRRPVPVRINAASWNVEERFNDWLVSRLAADYAVPVRVARRLVDDELVLPVLDGLDEMDPLAEKHVEKSIPRRARAAVEQINKPPWRGRPVVVMCRAGVYEEIRKLRPSGVDAGVHAATAVSLSPLTSEEIGEYLNVCREAEGIEDESWAPVTDSLAEQPEGVLADALATPWLLILAVTRLRQEGHEAAADLAAAPDEEALRTNLFATLIPMAIAGDTREGQGRSYTAEQAHEWLAGLAQHLSWRRAKGHGGTDIALSEVWQMAGRRAPRYLHVLMVGLLMGLAWAGFIVWLTGKSTDALWAFAAGLGFGIMFVLSFPVSPRRLARRSGRPRATLSRLRVVFASGAASGVVGLILGGLGGSFTMVVLYLPFGLAIGLLSALQLGKGELPVADERHIIRDDYIWLSCHNCGSAAVCYGGA